MKYQGSRHLELTVYNCSYKNIAPAVMDHVEPSHIHPGRLQISSCSKLLKRFSIFGVLFNLLYPNFLYFLFKFSFPEQAQQLALGEFCFLFNAVKGRIGWGWDSMMIILKVVHVVFSFI